MTPVSTWTPERVAELDRYLGAIPPMSASRIAEAMGLTKNAIIGRCDRRSLELPNSGRRYKIPDGEIETVRKLREAGCLLAWLAVQYGCSDACVRKALRRQRRVDDRATPNPFPPPRCCLYPHGDPGSPGFHFCGAPAVPGKPYCPEHMALCGVTVTQSRLANIEFVASRAASAVAAPHMPEEL